MLLSACAQKTPGNNKKERNDFEGIVTYKIIEDDFYKNRSYGDTMRLYYSHGNVIKEYNGKLPVLRKEIFLGSSNKYYMKIGDNDTLYGYDLKQNNSVTTGTSNVDKDTIILGHTCNKIGFDIHYTNPDLFTYCFFWYSPDVLRIDPQYFKDWKFGNFDQFINQSGCLYLKFQGSIKYLSQNKFVTRTYEAVSIEEKKLDPEIFSIENAPITEYKVN
jgi:hypothetical protein